LRRNKISSIRNLNKNTKAIAATAIFAALYAVVKLIPLGPMIGLSGPFSVADCLVPIYAILLGPYVGGASVILGTFLSFGFGRPVNFLGLDFLPAFINVVAIGLIMKKKWIPAIILNVALLAIFIVNPLTTLFIGSVPFFWLHIVALAVLISPLGYKAPDWIKTLKPAYIAVGLAILAFVGTMMQHLTGNILTEVVSTQLIGAITPQTLTTIIWPASFVVYPVERTLLVILSVVIGVPMIKALKTTLFPFPNKNKKAQPQTATASP